MTQARDAIRLYGVVVVCGPLFDQLAGVRDGGSAGYLLLLIDLDYFGRGMLCV